MKNDVSVPVSRVPELIRRALKSPNIKAILAQKPLSLTLEDAIDLRDHLEHHLLVIAHQADIPAAFRQFQQQLDHPLAVGPAVDHVP